jgi:hypothetical protein
VEIKLGSRLNGHPSIIHGGIISLLFDEAMGWARGVLLPDKNVMFMYVTVNLNVDYRAPLSADSEVLLRVFRDSDGDDDDDDDDQAKMKFRGMLESVAGKSIIYAEATDCLFASKGQVIR